MWTVIEAGGDQFNPKGNPQGVSLVIKGNYAFMMESVPMEYQMMQHCKLRQVGGLLDSKGYGIALPLESPYRKFFSQQILKLQESGTLNTLKEKWWVNRKGVPCPEDEKPHDDLDIGNVGGVFLVLIGGCFTAFIVACIEFMINVQNVAIEEKVRWFL
jgi:ionotropic glutamate receptor